MKLSLGLIGHLQMDMQGSVENEWLCSRLMQSLGLNTARCEIAQFGKQKVLAVERWNATARLAGLGDSAGLFAEIVAAAPRAVEEVGREIKSGFPAQIRDKIFEGFRRAVRSL